MDYQLFDQYIKQLRQELLNIRRETTEQHTQYGIDRAISTLDLFRNNVDKLATSMGKTSD